MKTRPSVSATRAETNPRPRTREDTSNPRARNIAPARITPRRRADHREGVEAHRGFNEMFRV